MTILWALLGALIAGILVAGLFGIYWFRQLDEMTQVWDEEDFM